MDQVGPVPQERETANSDFSAVLTPHRSLSPRGFVVLMSVVSVISFAAGMAFFLAGAWPVLGFFGLDVLLIYVAFKMNYYAGRAYETIAIAGSTLTITKVLSSGRTRQFTFNPYWARVDVKSQPGRASVLKLTSHGRSLVLGAFLSENERLDFATALREALATHRG